MPGRVHDENMPIRRLGWLPSLALLVGCPERVGSGDNGETLADEIDGSSSSSSETESSSGTSSEDDVDSSSDSSEAEAELETGPFPDLPDELPVGCGPLYFNEPPPGSTSTDIWSGWVVCSDTGEPFDLDGFRLEAVDCPFAAPFEPCDQCEGCAADEECLLHYPGGYCFCGNNCNSDSDCAPNESCLCRMGIDGRWLYQERNECLPSSCRGEADCEALPGDTTPLCRLGRDLCSFPETIQCRTVDDACTFDTDCDTEWCRWDQGDERWSCDFPATCE
jgi:hypothetical protein